MVVSVQTLMSGHGLFAVPNFDNATGPSARPSRRTALFVDLSVSGADILAGGAAVGTLVFVLEPGLPALAQIAGFVGRNGPFDALHIVAHGAPGTLAFSSGAVDVATLEDDVLARIGHGLADDATILLYGCETGAGPAGVAFAARLAAATGAHVAASSTKVGAAHLGGRWDLDVRTGHAEVGLFASPSALAAYPGTLAVKFSKETDPLGTIGSFEGRLVTGDFDNDGDDDILFQNGNTAGAGFGYIRNDGDGSFVKFVDANAAGTPFDNADFSGQQMTTTGVFAVDYDNDGDIDIIDRDSAGAGNTLGAWRNDDGSFSRVSGPIGGTGAFPSRMIAGDFDNDGDTDFLYQSGNTAGAGIGYLENDSTGTFVNFTDASASGSPFDTVDFAGAQVTTTAVFAVDYDNDGDIDLIDREGTDGGVNTIGVWRNDDGTFTRVADPIGNTGAFPGRMAFGDFDSDGDIDIFYQNGNTAGTGFGYLKNNGAGTFTDFTSASAAGTPFQGFDFTGQRLDTTSLYVVDYDNDGDVDILNRDTGGGLSVWVQGSDSGGDGSPPTLVSTSPADNATNVAPDANLSIVFDEAVTKGTGNIEIVRLSDGVVVATIAVTSGQVTGSGATWSINPPADLAALTGYGVRIEAGAFVDLDGAIYFGLDDETKFSFTTGVPNTPPTFANLNGDLGTFTENGPAVHLDVMTAATVTDGDSADFSGGSLTVSIVTNENAAEDILGFNTSGGTVSLSADMTVGSQVSVSGVVVGMISADGNGGDDLIVTLNANATPARTQALVRALTYSNADGLDPSTAARSIQITLTDGDGGTSAVQTVTVNVAAVNDAPDVTMPAPIAVTEDVARAITGIVFSDADAGSASVTVTLSVPSGTLAATSFGGVTVGGTTTATLTLTGSIANINAFIAGSRVTFTTAANATAEVTLTASINDGGNSGGGALTDTATVTLDVTAANDAPVVTTSGATTAFTEGQNVSSTPVVIDAALTLGDVDDIAFSSATISITGGFQSSEDVLAFTNDGATMGDIVLDGYVAGVLTLRSPGGAATEAQWQAALRSVTYANSSETPNTANRTISFVVNDGALNSLAATKTVSVAAVNDAPIVTMPAPIAVTEDVATAVTGISFFDADPGANVTVTLSVPSGTLAAASSGGVTVGGNASATMTLTGSITAINAFIADAKVSFTTATNATAGATLTALINDGALTDSGTVTLEVSAVNDAPIVTTAGATTAFTEGQNVASTPVVVDAALTLSDVDDIVFSRATISITGGFEPSQDVLAFTNDGATMGDIVLVGYVAGVLTLTSPGGGATVAEWQAALRSVTYANSSDTPNTANRTISFVVNDGALNSLAATKTVSIAAVNDAPVVTMPAPIAVTEDVATVVTGVSFSDADAGGASVTVTLSVPSGTLAAASSGGVTVGGNAGALTLTGSIANINAFIADAKVSFTTATDVTSDVTLTASIDDGGNTGGGALTDTAAVTLDVTAVNIAPSGANKTISVAEDGSRSFTPSDFGYSDADGNGLWAVIIATLPGDGTLTLDGTGVVAGQSIAAADIGGLVWAPDANASGNGLASFTFKVVDDGGTANGGQNTDPTANTITFNVGSINDAPSGANKTISVAEDGSRSFTASDFGFSDTDGNSLSAVIIATLPGNGTLKLNGVSVTAGQSIVAADLGKLVWKPTANANGVALTSFSFKVVDNGGTANGGQNTDQSPNTITFNVTPVNDAPVVSGTTPPSLSIAEFSAKGAQVGTVAIADPDGPAATFSLTDNAGGRFAIDAATGKITVLNGLLLDFEQAKSHQITVKVSDGAGGSISRTLVVKLTDVNPETVSGSSGSDSFVGGSGNDRLAGYGGNDRLTGGAGNDILNGGIGVDTMTGGTGDDRYYVDNVGDRVVELANQGADRIIATGVSYTLPAHVEALVIVGSGLTGRGGSGNDALYSDGAGNTLIGLAGNDTYVVNASNTRIIETATGGIEIVQANGVSYSLANAANVERLDLAGTGLTGTGTAAADVLVSEGTGNVLRGLGGNDAYAINAGDTVVEAAGGGLDRVSSSVTHTLGANVENLILSGKANLAGTGNELANVLVGNAGANRLSGLAGNDRLAGGLGADILIGGAGNDMFDFDAIAESGVGASSRDVIGDFVRGQDKITLATIDANSLLAGNQAFTFLGGASFTGAGQLRYVQEGAGVTAKTIVWGNVDGNPAADFHIELKGHFALTAGDFVL